MAGDPVANLKSTIPPKTDYLTYLTILESHLSPEILPTLDEILRADPVLTQNIGWDLIQLVLPLPGAEPCLRTIALYGNPREVVLKVTEALGSLDLSDDDSENDGETGLVDGVSSLSVAGNVAAEGSLPVPTSLDKFCCLLSVLSILHPRIKTRYPSRFLSTSLMAIMAAYEPSGRATFAVVSFVHALSGMKRPPLPHRRPTAGPSNAAASTARPAPDPEATAEEPQEEAIQKRLLQSFVTHILEEYVHANKLKWATRLLEHFDPSKVVPGRRAIGDAFKLDPLLKERDAIVGQLVALARDLDLSDLEALSVAMSSDMSSRESIQFDDLPSSVDDIPLSPVGCLFLVAYLVFSSIVFSTNFCLPSMSVFPGHAKLAARFLGIYGPSSTGTEEEGIIDAILSIGLWLEKSGKMFSEPLGGEDFLQHLQSLSLLSINSPSSAIRHAAHALTSSILHAHPIGEARLAFIIDTLENCPYENLKAAAVIWLKDEIINAVRVQSIFSRVAYSAAEPFLFPYITTLAGTSDNELLEELKSDFHFHMTVLNFLYFLSGRLYRHVTSPESFSRAAEYYLVPLRSALERLQNSFAEGGDLYLTLEKDEAENSMSQVQLLCDRLLVCVKSLEEVDLERNYSEGKCGFTGENDTALHSHEDVTKVERVGGKYLGRVWGRGM